MIENGSFYELNNISKLSLEGMIQNAYDSHHTSFASYLESKRGGFAGAYPEIYKFLTNATAFYEAHFSSLQTYIKREKRQLQFETPSRINVSIELSLELQEKGNPDTGAQYLFNVKDKLNWLMIYQNGKHITVASRYIVIEKINEILCKEIKCLAKDSGLNEKEVLSSLYDVSEGDPCFIMYEAPKDGNKSIIIELKYYDSVHHDENQKAFKEKYTPLYEQSIRYRFRALKANCSNWLYVRSPKDFAIELTNYGLEFNSLPSQDEEIKALYRKANNQRCDKEIVIDVRVVSSLRKWFLGICYFAIAICVAVGTILVVRLLALSVSYDVPFFTAESMKGLTPVLISMVAAVIATRGWLMHEEHVLLPIGKKYIQLVITLIILAALLIVFSLPLPLHEIFIFISEWAKTFCHKMVEIIVHSFK